MKAELVTINEAAGDYRIVFHVPGFDSRYFLEAIQENYLEPFSLLRVTKSPDNMRFIADVSCSSTMAQSIVKWINERKGLS